MKNTHFVFLLFLQIILPRLSLAQPNAADSSVYWSSREQLVQLYMDSARENLRLYNGTEFTAAYNSSLGHPFFEQPEPEDGTIFYDGIFYPGLKLNYDIIRDEVIFINQFRNLNVKPAPSKISWFTLRDHLFVHLFDDSNSHNFPGQGFYEELHGGEIAAFRKTWKFLHETSRLDEASRYEQLNTYYVRKQNRYYTIDSKRALIALFKDRKADVAKFIQREGLNFKKDPATMLAKVIDFYLNTNR
jgi:hypothetical protein